MILLAYIVVTVVVLLLRAVAGSRLYGTNKPESDYDFFEVHDKIDTNRKRHTIQTIVNGVDTIKTDFSTWLINCENGSHQHLDAMFTPPAFCEVDLIETFRARYRARVGVVIPTLERVIRSFNYPDSTIKQKAHAVRLQFMIDQMLETSRYNPVLNEHDRKIVRACLGY